MQLNLRVIKNFSVNSYVTYNYSNLKIETEIYTDYKCTLDSESVWT